VPENMDRTRAGEVRHYGQETKTTADPCKVHEKVKHADRKTERLSSSDANWTSMRDLHKEGEADANRLIGTRIERGGGSNSQH